MKTRPSAAPAAHKPKMKIYWAYGLSRDMPGRKKRTRLPDLVDLPDQIEQMTDDYCARIMGPDIKVTAGWMKETTGLISSLYLGMVNDVHVVNDIIEAERAGFDAAMLGCNWDPGLLAAREATTMPVTGPGEAGMMIAQTLGARFGYVTAVNDGYVPMIERNMRIYGVTDRAIARKAVRKVDLTYEVLMGSVHGTSDKFITDFEKAARGCIDDGADVIVAGGQFFGPALLKHRFYTIPNTGVPVVDVTACGLRLAEALVNLKRTVDLKKSEYITAPFRTPPREILDNARKVFGLVKPEGFSARAGGKAGPAPKGERSKR